VAAVELVKHRIVRGLWELGFFVDNRQDVHWHFSDERERWGVVSELNVCPVDVFKLVLLLLHLENVVHKKLLEGFVTVVDAKLFKRVEVKVFKPEDIEDTNGRPEFRVRLLWHKQNPGDKVNNVDEVPAKETLGKGLVGIGRLFGSKRFDGDFATGDDGSSAQTLFKVVKVTFDQRSGSSDRTFIINLRGLLAVLLSVVERDVTEVKARETMLKMSST